jgi:hypothetical protein
MSSPNDIIGRVELVDLPEFNLVELEAKIDTGADSSALHCTNIRIHDDNSVSFCILDPNHPDYVGQELRMPIFTCKWVKSSNGISKKRAYIQTHVFINGKNYPIIISLTDRSKMSKPMLLGRRFLEGKFLVDVSIQHNFNNKKRTK